MLFGQPYSPVLHFQPYLQQTPLATTRTRLTSISSPFSSGFGSRPTDNKSNLPKGERGKFIVQPISTLPIEEMAKKNVKSYHRMSSEGSEFLRRSVELNQEDQRKEYVHRNVFITDTHKKVEPLSAVDNLRKTNDKIPKPKMSKSNSRKKHNSEQAKKKIVPKKEVSPEVPKVIRQTVKNWDSYGAMLQPISEYYEKPVSQANIETLKLKPKETLTRNRSNTMKNLTRHKSLSLDMQQISARIKKDMFKQVTAALAKSVEGKKAKCPQVKKAKGSQRYLETKELNHTKVSSKWNPTKSGKFKIPQ